MLRALPPGKGKARYFLRAIAEVLQLAVDESDLPSSLRKYAQREFMARSESQVEAAIVEVYARLDHGAQVATVDSGVKRFFNVALAEEYSVELLTVRREQTANHVPEIQVEEDPQRVAIRRWLENEATNRQLLLPLRQGVARWLRMVGAPQILTRDGIAKPHGVLRWEERYLDVVPPIIIEGVDEELEGVVVPRSIGLLAFDFTGLAKAKGNETRRLAVRIAEDNYAAELLDVSNSLRVRLMHRLETQLGMPLEQFALHCYIFVLCLGRECPPIPVLPSSFWSWLRQEQTRRAAWRMEIDSSTENTLTHLFDDFFRLRENIVDGALIAHLCHGLGGDDWVAPLLQIQRSAVDSTFVLGHRPLAEVIRVIQEIVGRWLQDNNGSGLSPASQVAIDHIVSSGIQGAPLAGLSKEVLSELEATQPEFFVRLRVRLP